MSNLDAPKVKPTPGHGPARAFFSCHNMQAYYGESYIVQGVGFDVHEGGMVALPGKNGDVKTLTSLPNALA